ncbi:MAG: glycosyltransferase family 39 protein, partial [Chloroflexota bacterium]
MAEENRGFQEQLNGWILKAGDFISLQMVRLLRLLQTVWKWYQSINWPDIPLTPMQWVLSFYFFFGVIFMVASPIFEVSDELWHFGMVDYLRQNDGTLPEYDVSDPDAIYENNLDTIYRQEGSQPPLYYYTMALVTSPISIADADEYRETNPHARAGRPASWGNKNLVLHSTDGVPLSGTPLAVYLMRLLGLGMGCVTIFAVWRIGELIAPHRPVVGLLAATLTAFNPMFLFISASVNNDVMVIMLNSVVILLGLQTLREGFDTRRSILLAVLLALATLTKLSALVLVPV